MQVGYDAIATEQCCNFSVALKLYQWAIALFVRKCDRAPISSQISRGRDPFPSQSAIGPIPSQISRGRHPLLSKSAIGISHPYQYHTQIFPATTLNSSDISQLFVPSSFGNF
ncbi:hypothetical protein [Microcoleus anatoxicus]|uniref:hypothetical protein n=1 Tax=Microcoleus anatoxicus TaxID=2705319 RepID=UPI0030C90CC2